MSHTAHSREFVVGQDAEKLAALIVYLTERERAYESFIQGGKA